MERIPRGFDALTSMRSGKMAGWSAGIDFGRLVPPAPHPALHGQEPAEDAQQQTEPHEPKLYSNPYAPLSITSRRMLTRATSTIRATEIRCSRR